MKYKHIWASRAMEGLLGNDTYMIGMMKIVDKKGKAERGKHVDFCKELAKDAYDVSEAMFEEACKRDKNFAVTSGDESPDSLDQTVRK